MSFADANLGRGRPAAVRDVTLPRRTTYHPSPADWRDEIIYFLLPDRFSGNGVEARGADIIVDLNLNSQNAPGHPWGSQPPFFEVIANSAQTAAGPAYQGSHPVGERLPARQRDGAAYVEIRNVPPSEVIVLSNRPQTG